MAIKLLTPISHLFENSINAKKISSLSDCLEARERTHHLRFDNTTHYHIDFDINLGINEEQKAFLKNNVAPREQITNITFQASRDCLRSVLMDGAYQKASRTLSLEEQLKNVKSIEKTLTDILGTDRNLGFENNNYYPTGAYEICTSVEFINTVLETTNFHLLLDYAHAQVTSINLKINPDSYIQDILSTGQCRQIHFCSHSSSIKNEKITAIDSHDKPDDKTIKSVINIAKKHKVEYLTVEYYKDPSILCDVLSNVFKAINCNVQ